MCSRSGVDPDPGVCRLNTFLKERKRNSEKQGGANRAPGAAQIKRPAEAACVAQGVRRQGVRHAHATLYRARTGMDPHRYAGLRA